MYESTELLSELRRLLRSITSRIDRISTRIENAPPESLRIIKNRKSHQYYHRIEPSDPQGVYINRKDRSIAVSLAQKDYDKKLLKVLKHQQKAIEKFMKDFVPGEAHQVFENLIEPRKELVDPEYISDEDYIKLWLNTPYKKLGFNQNDPKFYTASGERVRSKSEILIADALLRYNIPYRYEYPVYHNGIIMAVPDFNCLNVRLRKEYYWEHLGKLGDQDYSNRNVSKLENTPWPAILMKQN